MLRLLQLLLVILIVFCASVPFWLSTPPVKEAARVDEEVKIDHKIVTTTTHGVYFKSVDDFSIQPHFTPSGAIPDFGQIANVTEKKQAYFEYITRTAENINAIIETQRQFVTAMNQLNVENWTKQQRDAVDYLLTQYRVKLAWPDAYEPLLFKLAPVPEPLIAVQTANESGWGSSRFARDGYNFFGLWCFKKGCGFVPKQRNAGANHEVAKFKSLPRAMYRYLVNLNRHPAYREMREIRHSFKGNDPYELSYAMIGGLQSYSERGDAYIEELRSMLRVNRQLL